MKVSFPHLGMLYVYLQPYINSLGMEAVVPPPTSKRTLDIGVRHCPELTCTPCKIIFGNYVEALEHGADTLIMLGGMGACRLGYSVRAQRDKLLALGFQFQAVTFSLLDAQADLVRVNRFLTGKSLFGALDSIRLLIDAMRAVDSLEQLALTVRPRELQRGETDRILREAWHAMECCRTRDDVRLFGQTYREKLAAVPCDPSREVLRIALVGDPFSILDAFFNMDIEKKLGRLGVEVNRWFWLGGSLDLFPIKDWLGLSRQKRAARLARQYVRGDIGGFAFSTVGETILLSQEGYDGLIHLAPFNCTPEVVAENVLLAYERHSPVPILNLSFDEHTSDAGISTRVEAFTDLLHHRRALRAREAGGVQ